jgi:hypothetical protein
VLGDPINFYDPDGLVGKPAVIQIGSPPTTQIKIGGMPMTIEGPYKTKLGTVDKIGNFGLSKLLIEKYSMKILKIDPITGAIKANPIGLGISALAPNQNLAACQGLYCDGDGDHIADFFYEKGGMCVPASN